MDSYKIIANHNGYLWDRNCYKRMWFFSRLMPNCHFHVIYATRNITYYTYIVMNEITNFISHMCHEWAMALATFSCTECNEKVIPVQAHHECIHPSRCTQRCYLFTKYCTLTPTKLISRECLVLQVGKEALWVWV